MMDRVELASKHVYDVDLREFQRDVLASMFDHRNLKQLVVARTGAGKTHIMRMVSAVLQGIHLYMCPLLSLMADIAKKFREGSDAFGAIEVFNLDELASRCATTRNRILERLAAMKTSSTTTIILLASPQFLCNHKEFVDGALSHPRWPPCRFRPSAAVPLRRVGGRAHSPLRWLPRLVAT